MKRIHYTMIKDSFWQLITLYTAIIIAIALGFLSPYARYFNILAIVIAIIGFITLKETTNKHAYHKSILIILLLAIFVIRIIPYFSTSVPLGYDPGIYKYGFEDGLQNRDGWILEGGQEPGFLYLTKLFSFLPTDFYLKQLFILVIVLLGFALYLATKEYFNERTALYTLAFYAFSLIQFKTFWYLYYKNVLGLALIFFALYFLLKKKPILFVLFAGFSGAVHRPSFYIFGISYFIYTFIQPYAKKTYDMQQLKINILQGVGILAVMLVFYIGDFFQAITSIFPCWLCTSF